MNSEVYINLVVEDQLSENILRVILNQCGRTYIIRACYSGGGYGYIKKNIHRFNKAAKFMPFLILTDLDIIECPPILIKEWLKSAKHPNLLIRVAVREVEGWIMADREGFSRLINGNIQSLPPNMDTIKDPKQFLFDMIRKYAGKDIKTELLPRKNSTAKVGPNYNQCLSSFLYNNWNMKRAIQYSESLKRDVSTLENFTPV